MNKLIKLSALLLLSSNIAACISTTGLAREQVNNNKEEGILYGLNWSGAGGKSTNNIIEICKAIQNKDERCNAPSDYGSVPILSSQGFADGPMGAIAIFKKSEIIIDKGCNFPSSASCTFYKVVVERNKLATLLSVVSKTPVQGCKWNGLNGAGGTVCAEFNWYYRKDNKPAIFF